MITIKLGGVPEHFNLPILLAKERGAFEQADIDLHWTYYPGGTGAMTKALAQDELDMAILLTEGFIAAVNSGLQAQIVKVYIDSPLVWGIYTGAQAATHSLYDHHPKHYAISRYGSGSHLMALIHAEQRGETIAEDDFVIINSLENAVLSLTKNETQVFYWEKLMTKKYVESGELKLIGEFSAPWSSFLMVATQQAINQNTQAIHQTLKIINDASKHFKENTSTSAELQKRFGLSPTDIRKWLAATVWNTNFNIKRKGLLNATHALSKVSPKPIETKVETLCAASLHLK